MRVPALPPHRRDLAHRITVDTIMLCDHVVDALIATAMRAGHPT